jgi:hypothetical protein
MAATRVTGTNPIHIVLANKEILCKLVDEVQKAHHIKKSANLVINLFPRVDASVSLSLSLSLSSWCRTPGTGEAVFDRGILGVTSIALANGKDSLMNRKDGKYQDQFLN